MDCEWRNVCHDSDGFVAEAMMIHTNYALKEEGRCLGSTTRMGVCDVVGSARVLILECRMNFR